MRRWKTLLLSVVLTLLIAAVGSAAEAQQDMAPQPSAGTQPSTETQPSEGTLPSTGTQPSEGSQPSTGTQPSEGTQPSTGTQPSEGVQPPAQETEHETEPQGRWETRDGRKYYYNARGKLVKGLQEINGKTYYFNKQGEMQTGWQTIKKQKYYFGSKGVMATGLKKIGKKTYFFDKTGVMKTGKRKVGKKTYYFDSKGEMQTGWQTIKKKKYYFNSKGVMVTGLKTIAKKVYYFDKSGVMQTGKQKFKKKTYYFNLQTGVRETGWINIGKKAYYFDPKTGEMDSSKTRKAFSELEQLCEKIVNSKVKSSDSVNTKLSKLFSYVTWSHSYYRTYNFTGAAGWHKTYALNMLKSRRGNCYGYAAAFAYLAKKATDLPIRVGWGSTPAARGGLTPHGWCEIKIGGTWYVFDPDLYRYVYSGNCYYKTMGQVGGFYYNRKYATVEF